MTSVHADPPPPIVTDPSGVHYATGPALGKGGFAICHRAERYNDSRPTGKLVALKIVKTKMEPAKLAQKFVTELQIHSKLSHSNIVAFYRAFSFGLSTYVVLELCPNGSLADMLKKRKHLTLPEIRRFVIQICGAVKYLHHRHIVHRDLKTGNLFLDSNMDVKVGDFGLAALLVTEKDMAVQRRTTMCGTPNYLAPEILEKGKGHDEKVDLWAIGVIAYTLAVGKAPFHATTKEEIYKKLKSGTYTWPELASTTNQSADLRDLVSSLLVPEEQRLVPDEIVSQNFFKTAFVPSSIPTLAREKVPRWPEISLPTPDVLRRGYSETWFAICRESGVGEYEPGKCFKLNGGRRVKSIVHDMALEVQSGRQPTMPIPKDVVYLSPICSWDETGEMNSENFGACKATGSRGLSEIAQNEVALPRFSVHESKAAKDLESMPPPKAPVRANKSGITRKAARTISEETAKALDPIRISSDALTPALSIAKTRDAPLIITSTRPNDVSTNVPTLAATNSQNPTDSSSMNTVKPRTVKRSADASLARRPKTTARSTEKPVSPELPGRPSTWTELKSAPSVSNSKQRLSKVEAAELLLDAPREKQTSSSGPLETLPASTLARSKYLTPSDTPNSQDLLSGTGPSQVLQRLRVFHDNLAAALHNAVRSRMSAMDAESLPFVTRWVDYSRKHGFGYVLAGGTVGCVINASPKNATPVTHVVVRNGRMWLSKVGKNFENIEDVPIEVFEDCGTDGLVRKVYKGLGSVKEGPLYAEAERRRILSILWVKFGRYMCQSLDGDEKENYDGESNFVRFYQRIGTVGLWAFADGSLQVHFPDHTKLILSAQGTHMSTTCISPEAVTYLDAHASLLPHHVGSREVFTDSIAGLLHDGSRLRTRYMKANAMRAKLEFVAEVTDQWVRNGGLGKLDDDRYGSASPTSSSLRWKGLCVADLAKRDDRVTVGRFGGDEVLR